MAIKLVRKPSDTPNINNIDDIVGLRYAYGNQNGYVIDKGNEISHSVNGSTFRINSGRLVLQGVEVDIDANGLDLTVDNFATKQFYSVYLTVNLALNSVQIQFTVDTAGYPEIDPGDDLTKNTSGIARLELYRFTAQNGIISNVEKVVKQIEYAREQKVAEADNSDTLQRFVPSDDAADIENSTPKTLASAAAIKKFMEEYYMKSYTGNLSNISVKISATMTYYLVKQGNDVTLSVEFLETAKTKITGAKMVLLTAQLPSGFYNTTNNIVAPVTNTNDATPLGYLTDLNITTSGQLSMNVVRGSDAQDIYPTLPVMTFKYTI